MMIRLSTRGRYGLRAMIALAGSGGRPLGMGEISAAEGLPRKYLHEILSALRGAGLVESRRGARGGYLLAREPAGIAVREVVAALEGDMDLVGCVGDPERCPRSPGCAARELWLRASRAMDAVLDGTTLADLVPGAVQRAGQGPQEEQRCLE